MNHGKCFAGRGKIYLGIDRRDKPRILPSVSEKAYFISLDKGITIIIFLDTIVDNSQFFFAIYANKAP